MQAASTKTKVLLAVTLALVAWALWLAINHPPKLGLDLQGGTRLTLEAEPNAQVKTITPQVMDSLHSVIEKRVNKFGVSEALVQKAGTNRLIVEIPGAKDPGEARRQLGKVGNLEFKKEDGKGGWVASGVSGQDLASARLDANQGGQWLISFMLTGPGTDKFANLTQALYPKQGRLGIFFDGELVSAPVVRSAILQGSGVIEGQFSREEAKEMVDLMNAGALPVDVSVIEENTVGPLLGQESVQKSLVAGGIGLGLVLLFMLGYYRAQGMVANIALLFYALLSYAAYLMLDVTFTMAGIAGFILSIGMAVDANILIFERTKEELKAGKAMMKAIEAGFDRAFPSIFDSNMTTLITCALLWWLGTGSVKGFALTLAVGVAVSMYSAITVTRTILELALSGNDPASTRTPMTFSRG